MSKLIAFAKKNFFLLLLLFFSLVFFAVALRLNFFRYNNFDYGKFDLGNMTQMVWNASRGDGLYLTDYFGTNLPRWAMSHVDPILFTLVPVFWVFPHPMTLVVAQLVLVIFSSLIVFKLTKFHLKSQPVAFLLGMAYLFNPSIGYLTAFTGFHGVTFVIPFFLLAFYLYEKMYSENRFDKKRMLMFWALLILTMMGKEQIPLYVFLYGFFILVMRNPAQNVKELLSSDAAKRAYSMMAVGALWFYAAFFVIIPRYADHRVEGYAKFAETLELADTQARDVALPNYFLNRYEEFGDSYSEVAKNVILDPRKSISVFFGGDKPENFRRTFEPLAFLPFAAPFALLMAVPDLMINFLTTAGGIGTAEIMNHRISMILPVLFIATILGLGYIAGFFSKYFDKKPKILLLLATLVAGFTIYTTHVYNNPIYLWMSQAVRNKILVKVFAKSDTEIIKKDLELGEVVRLSELEDKDRECAASIVQVIPDGASVSGPDSLGAHLSMRKTYAIFPALFNEADYVIVDVFSRKILTILDLDVEIVRDVVEELIKDENYKLQLGCGNYFVFKNVGEHAKEELLPIQERFEFDASTDLEFFQGVTIADYDVPAEIGRGQNSVLEVVYFRAEQGDRKDSSLEQYTMFTSFVNKETGEIYQQANLPSFAIKQPQTWEEGRYYAERIEFVVPEFLDAGDYMVFVGMGNRIRTRSIYLGDSTVN